MGVTSGWLGGGGKRGASANKNKETNAVYKPARRCILLIWNVGYPTLDNSTTKPIFSLERGDLREAGHLAKRTGRITLSRALHRMANITGQQTVKLSNTRGIRTGHP